MDYNGPAIDEQRLRTMAGTLRHRGPDDSGVAALGPAGLAQTRLSIQDLSDAGHQPMQTPDGRITLVYNGELYNFPELRKRLEAEGVRFRGHCDTEAILHAYALWGAEAFPLFNGMFAIALWDAPAQRLVLARDRFGIKPMYYAGLSPGGPASGLVFGSEIKALLASGRVHREMSWKGLHEYAYYGNALGEHTLFRDVKKLLAGHYLTLDRSGAKIAAYWSVEEVEPVGDDLEQATATVRTRLEAAVRDHLISDVPVGVFLSGGVDSSAITALASRHYGGRLKTYSVGYDFDPGVDELPKARRVAEHFHTEHHELQLSSAGMPQVIEHLVRAHDEPFGDAADIPLYLLCRELKGSVKVILQGDGGDEIFAGYRRYNVLSYERFWQGVSRAARPLGLSGLKGPRVDRLMRFVRAMGQPDPAERLARLMTQEPCDPTDGGPARVLSADAHRELSRFDPFARYRELYARLAHLDPVQRGLYIDTMVLLPDCFLEKVDKSTMAHSIEVRVPFLDAHLTEYVLGLPSRLKIRSRQKKFLLRRALRGIVPDEILDGPKVGFGVPYSYWLRTSLAQYMRSVLLDPATARWNLFDDKALGLCIDEHVGGRRDHGFLLYKMLLLALWRGFYLDGTGGK